MPQTIQESLAHTKDAPSVSNGHQIEYLDTVEAYDKWAEVYDTDGNFLQALDTIEMREMLPRFMSLVLSMDSQSGPRDLDKEVKSSSLNLVDLGCGTGRNTLQLIKAAPARARVTGLDASQGMLDVATVTIQNEIANGDGERERVTLGVYDLLSSCPQSLPIALEGQVSGIISTLVLEHIPLDKFFLAAVTLIKPGGYLLVTNMHAEMGGISQAGFVDAKTGAKIRPTSYAHEIRDVLAAGGRAGFEVVSLDESEEKVRERRVNEKMVGGLGERGKKWVGVMVWFGVCFRMRSEL
ncbi:S-adenosyl-L-methionine-dependent methyltransferase [Aspergillus californicus]